jgi:PAS domain S-box-containing protein
MKDVHADIPHDGGGAGFEDLPPLLDGSLGAAAYEGRAEAFAERLARLQLANLELRETLAALESRYAFGADRYEFAPVACCGLDASGTITDINVAGAALLGCPMASIVGRPLASFVVATDQNAVREHVRSCEARGVRTMTEARVVDDWGAETAVHIISAPILSPVLGSLVLATALVDVSTSMVRRDLPHDLRGDLATILFEATRALLPSGPIDPGVARQALQQVRVAAERMRQGIGPAAKESRGDGAGDSVATPSRAERNGLVLVVDDAADSRSVLEDLLCWHGYAVVPAASVDDALDYLRTGSARPDLVVLDLHLPGRDGWQFLAERSHDAALRSIPVLVVSGQPDVERRVAAAQAHFVSKPLSSEAAIASVARAIVLGPTVTEGGRWQS